jgi:hypothetical protein
MDYDVLYACRRAGVVLFVIMFATDLNPEPKRFLLESALAQELYGWGVIFYRGGRLKTRFSVKASGTWDGRTLMIEEYLRYESGEAHHRTFHIEKINDDHYTAECGEFIGPSEIRRRQSGFQWRYRLREKSKEAHGITLAADDRLFLCADGTLLDHAILRKLGVRVGDVFMTLRPASSLDS